MMIVLARIFLSNRQTNQPTNWWTDGLVIWVIALRENCILPLGSGLTKNLAWKPTVVWAKGGAAQYANWLLPCKIYVHQNWGKINGLWALGWPKTLHENPLLPCKIFAKWDWLISVIKVVEKGGKALRFTLLCSALPRSALRSEGDWAEGKC